MNVFTKLFTNKEVHDQKNHFASEILSIHHDISKIVESSKNAKNRIEQSVTYKIAIAQGAKKRGLE